MIATSTNATTVTIGLCGIGDPAQRQTWSGTPWRVRRELLNCPGVCVKTRRKYSFNDLGESSRSRRLYNMGKRTISAAGACFEQLPP